MRRTPVATYRVQLRQGFDFHRAAAIVPYLAELGVSHVYLSPCFRAAEGSTHGYDVTDPNRVDEALGGEAGRGQFLAALAEHGLDHVIDVVPNHMSVATDENAWWWDVLENGQVSPYASFFDVDWESPKESANGKVLLPILTDHYGRALEARQMAVARAGGSFVLSAMGRKLPLSARSLAPLLLTAADSVHSAELEFLAEALGFVGVLGESDPGETARRLRHQRVIQRQLGELFARRPDIAAEVDRRIEELNSDVEGLDAVIARQYYRLAHYRIARYDLDYRRFFDIHDLAALSLHRPRVLEATHALVFDWMRRGEVGAVRVDHPDGLRDPSGYFERLRAEGEDVWILAEKILQPGEALPADWPIDGTTGYDFLNAVGGLFVARDAEAAMSELYREFLGAAEAVDFAAEARASKRFVLDDLLASDLWRLARTFQRICASKRRHVDFADEELRRALREVVACLPVYRTYLHPSSPDRPADIALVRAAVAQAREQSPDLDFELLGFLEELLSGRCLSELEWELVVRFQQLSAAATAKGVEDTAFYRYVRLVALNEVGGEPGRFGTTLDEFHAFAADVQRRWPRTLLATTTHDTKRSEDARLRIAALTEMPDAWAAEVRAWSERAARHRRRDLLDRGTEYLIWQTLVAAHPLSEERLLTYLEKATREAKIKTSWLAPSPEYEAEVQRFARAVLADGELVARIDAFVSGLLPIARRSSLSQTLIKLTAPGVPDIYQGAELWDTRLTDPDNRGPVDFERFARELEAGRARTLDELARDDVEGASKQRLIQRALAFRARRPELFGAEASYAPVRVRGARAECVVAFSRADRVVTVAPRLFHRLARDGFEDTRIELPSGRFQNLFDRDAVHEGAPALERLIERFPVALLVREEDA